MQYKQSINHDKSCNGDRKMHMGNKRKAWKYKGVDTIEYALLLAIVVGIGATVSSSLMDNISGIFSSSGQVLGYAAKASSNKNDDPSQKVDDRNMKWLTDIFLDSATKDSTFKDYLGKYPSQRKDPNFTNDNGLIDSASGSKFVGNIDSSLLENSSWVFGGYTENGTLYYNVSIYSPEKNGNQKLSDLKPGTTILTDIYRVNPKTGEITKLQSNATQKVTDRGKNYNSIRDMDYK